MISLFIQTAKLENDTRRKTSARKHERIQVSYRLSQRLDLAAFMSMPCWARKAVIPLSNCPITPPRAQHCNVRWSPHWSLAGAALAKEATETIVARRAMTRGCIFVSFMSLSASKISQNWKQRYLNMEWDWASLAYWVLNWTWWRWSSGGEE